MQFSSHSASAGDIQIKRIQLVLLLRLLVNYLLLLTFDKRLPGVAFPLERVVVEEATLLFPDSLVAFGTGLESYEEIDKHNKRVN